MCSVDFNVPFDGQGNITNNQVRFHGLLRARLARFRCFESVRIARRACRTVGQGGSKDEIIDGLREVGPSRCARSQAIPAGLPKRETLGKVVARRATSKRGGRRVHESTFRTKG